MFLFDPPRSRNDSASPPQPYGSGEIQVSFPSSDMEIHKNDSTVLEPSNTILEQHLPRQKSDHAPFNKRKSSTLESQVDTSTKISGVRSKIYEETTPIMNLSPTSPPDSTSNGKVCVPFWNEFTAELSRKLWS